MNTPKSIAILFREGAPESSYPDYMIWRIAELWNEWGLDVRFVQGPNADTSADLLIPYVDLSVTPEEYRRLFDKAGVVMNRGILDIRKSSFSRNLVTESDDYDGPVIVKTNANFGGQPEKKVYGRPPLARRAVHVLRQFLRTGSLSRLAHTRTLNPRRYPVYESKRAMPRCVFKNPHLVVERYLPEFDGRFYYVRTYAFLGCEDISYRLMSERRVVKNSVSTRLDFLPADEAIVAMRHEMGLDFGRMDYTIHDGQAVLLDVNRTPACGRRTIPPDTREMIASRLAGGIRQWFPNVPQAAQLPAPAELSIPLTPIA